MSGLSALAEHGFSRPFFEKSGIVGVDSFVEAINTKLVELKGEGYKPSKNAIAYCAAVILQDLIIQKLKEKREVLLNGPGSELKKKAAVGAIDTRTEELRAVVPTSESVPESPTFDNSKKASYTRYLNNIFHVSYKDWRDILTSEVKSNQIQCIRALNMKREGSDKLITSPEISDLQNKCKPDEERECLDCYICGGKMYSNQHTMNCEHVLPISSALSHWWLMKGDRDDYTTEELDEMELEYDWAHECCNMLKDNFDFIKFDKKDAIYMINTVVITNLCNAINESNSYDCGSINTIIINERLRVIGDKLSPILAKINENIRKFPEVEFYRAFVKFKLISAISEEDFLRAILGDGTVVKAATIKETNAERERRKAAEEEAAREARNQLTKTMRSARYLANKGDIAEAVLESLGRVGKRKTTEAEIAASGDDGEMVTQKLRELDERTENAELTLNQAKPSFGEGYVEMSEEKDVDYWGLDTITGGKESVFSLSSYFNGPNINEEFTKIPNPLLKDNRKVIESSEEPTDTIKYIIDTVNLDKKLYEYLKLITIDINQVNRTFDEQFGKPTDKDKLDIGVLEGLFSVDVTDVELGLKGGKTNKSRARKTKKSKRTKSKRNNKKNKKSKNKRTRRHK